MKKIGMMMIAGISIFLVITSCFSTFAYADIHEKKNIIIKPNGIESEWLLLTTKNRETQFNITSNIPVNIYLMTSGTYFDLDGISYNESDFSINVYEQKNVQETSFTWTQPDDQSYYLVIFNPNAQNATISYSYTETLLEELGESFTKIFEGICAGTMCIIGIIFYFFISLIIAYWMLKDADKRERNGIVWFIIGLILGIIGLIIWYIIRPKTLKSEIKKIDSDRRCPNCGRIIPEDMTVLRDEGLIRVEPESIAKSFKLPRKKLYGEVTEQQCYVGGYQPLRPEELPKPTLDLDVFLYKLTDNWHGEESLLFSTEIAINVLSCPKSSYGIGGIGAQSLAPLGSTRDLVHLNTSLRWLLPGDFLKQNKAYMYKPIITPDDAKSANRAYTRMISDELSFNYLFNLSPEAERMMMPTQIPVIIPDVQYSKRQWGLDRDVFDYEMSAMLIHPHIEQSTQDRLAKIVQKTGKTLLRKSYLQLPLDNTGLLRLANSWARLHFKQTITEDDFTHMKNDVEGIFSEYFDFIEDAKETGRTIHHPLSQMPTRFNLTTDANKILKHFKRISRETGLERIPLAELRRGILTSDISDYDLERGLKELVASNLLLQFKNFTEFILV